MRTTPAELGATVINVAYYRATAVGGEESTFDRAEVSELRWFGWDELPPDLVPPGTLAAVLAAARSGAALADRPTQVNAARTRPVDGRTRDIQRAALDPLLPDRVERVGLVQEAVRGAEPPWCDLELEEPEGVPRLGVLRLELHCVHVGLLGRSPEALQSP